MTDAVIKLKALEPSEQNRQGNTSLSLWFTSERGLELIKTRFCSPSLSTPVVAVRGKTAGAFSTSATFQWTAAVQALSLLLLRAAVRHETHCSQEEPLLEGGKGSLASSLDASLYKKTAWLDLFGADIRGDSMSKRVLRRTNPGRRRSGPVMISLNEKLLPRHAIEVFLDDQRIKDPGKLNHYAFIIEDSWMDELRPADSAKNGPVYKFAEQRSARPRRQGCRKCN